MNGGIPLRKGMNQFESFVGRRGYVPDGSVTQAHEMFVDSTAEHLEQGVVVAAGIEQDDGMKVEPQLFPRNGFQQFFQRAAAAGQGDDGIGEVGHALFAAVYVGGDYEFFEAGVVPPVVVHELRNDSRDFASLLHHGIGQRAHESLSAGPVDAAYLLPGEQLPQGLCGLEVDGGNPGT